MITDYDRKMAEEAAEEFDEARRRHNEGLALAEVLRHSLAFERDDTNREEKLLHCMRAAATKLRMNDAAGALLTLECGLRL